MKQITRLCSQCKSPLILVSEITATPEGSRFAQTHTVYRCSNQECQDEKDKQEAKRQELRKEKVLADQKRADRIAEKRKKIEPEKTAH